LLKYTLITTVEGLRRVANLVHDAKLIGFDIETARPGRGAVFDPRLGKIRLMQFNIAGVIYIVDLWQVEFIDPLIDAMRSTKAIWIIHNAKYEQKWLWHHHKLELWPIFDTFRAAGLVYNGRAAEPLRKGKAALDLDSCVVRELKEKPVNTGKGGSNWAGTLSEHQLAYAAEDVSRLPQLRERLWEKMRILGLFQVAMIEFSVVLPEATAELNGFPVDPQRWTELADHHRIESRRLAEELLYEMPNPYDRLCLPGMNGSWNLNSPPQLLRSLHRMGCDVKSTDHNTLAMRVGNFEVIKKILTWREHVTRLKMFGPDWLSCIHPVTGRVHTSYYSLLAAGRYSSSDPNLQQIPRQAVYRSCFTAPPGKVFVLADYSGIEMRIVAEISGDEKLIRIFCNDEDAHYATAALIMAKTVAEVVKAERQMAKPVNFGFIYGMGAERLVLYAFGNYGVAMTLDDAKLFRKRYFSREFGYAGVASWHNKIRTERESGMKISRTMAGRLRFLDPQKHYNEYFNTPVQGTGADALKMSLRNIHNRIIQRGYGDSVKLVHHVHDEIILECDDDPELIKTVKQDLEESMIEGMSPFLTKVPIVVDASHGKTWADAK
jgi:DNA polymerase-1